MGLFHLFNRFATKKGQSLRHTNRARLSCEELEGRLLLSTIEIHTTVPNALVEITFSHRESPGNRFDDKVDFTVKDRDTGAVNLSDSKPLGTLTDINIFTNAGNDRCVIKYGNITVARNGGRDVPLNVVAFGGSDTLELLNQSFDDAATPYVINGSEAGMHGINCTFSGIDILKVGTDPISPPVFNKLNFQFQPGGMLSEVHVLGTADGVLDLSALSTGMTVNLKQSVSGQLYAQGIHTVFGGSGDDTLIGSDAADLLFGNGGADLLIGNGGNDVLVGGAGWDYLYGDAGRDILIGGIGSDWLEGGADADIVINGTTNFDTNSDRLKSISMAWGLGVPIDLVDAAHATSLNRQTVFDDNETDTFASRRGTNDTNGDKIFIEPPHVIGSRMTSSGITLGGTTIRAISSFPVGLEFGGDKTVIAINWVL